MPFFGMDTSVHALGSGTVAVTPLGHCSPSFVKQTFLLCLRFKKVSSNLRLSCTESIYRSAQDSSLLICCTQHSSSPQSQSNGQPD